MMNLTREPPTLIKKSFNSYLKEEQLERLGFDTLAEQTEKAAKALATKFKKLHVEDED